ncbi:MAG: glycosyltransferase family 39 protein [candidate division Zixibacteria bacterium]|nr:glycosyltransferase family 39 protein [candidate division Zixibacteria bacterium]
MADRIFRLTHLWRQYVSLVENHPVIVLVVCSSLFLSLGWWQNGINLDSTTYSVIARNMMDHGHWFNPTYTTYSHPNFAEHPPLVMWAQAVLFWLFGATDSTARLFGAICTTGSVLAVFWLGRSVGGKRLGLLSGLVLILTYNFMQGGNSTLLDYPMTFFVLMALAGLAHISSEEDRVIPRWAYVVTGLALGCSFLTKGVVSGPVWIGMFTGFLLHHHWSITPRVETPHARTHYVWLIPGIAIFLVGAYLVLDQWFADGHFLEHYFLIQIGRRFMGGGPKIHTDWYEFLFRFAKLYLPWIILLPVGVYSVVKKKVTMLLPLSITLILYIISYSSAAKLYYHYFAPAYALSAVFVALGLTTFIKMRMVPTIAAVFLIIWMSLGIGVTAAGVKIHHIRCTTVYNLTDKMTDLFRQSEGRNGIMVCPHQPDWDIIAKTAWYWHSDVAWTNSLEDAGEIVRTNPDFSYLLLPPEDGQLSTTHQPDNFTLYAGDDKLAVYIPIQ